MTGLNKACSMEKSKHNNTHSAPSFRRVLKVIYQEASQFDNTENTHDSNILLWDNLCCSPSTNSLRKSSLINKTEITSGKSTNIVKKYINENSACVHIFLSEE